MCFVVLSLRIASATPALSAWSSSAAKRSSIVQSISTLAWQKRDDAGHAGFDLSHAGGLLAYAFREQRLSSVGAVSPGRPCG
jgi:hypothetical protein